MYNAGYRRILSRMGYYSYQNGLIYRHLNQEGGWDEHLSHCRTYILEAMEHFKPGKVTILGSGWLLDLPLAEIVEKTGEVMLVDIIHPPEVVRQVAEFRNVELIEDDVSGGLIEEVWTRTRGYSFLTKMRSLDGIRVPVYKPGFDPGMVISLNLLTQLEVLPLELINKRSKISEEEIAAFRKTVQENHLNFLSGYRSVMISDVEEVHTSNDGSVAGIPTLFARVPDGSRREDWTWNFDLKGSDFYNSRSVMKVMAVTFGE